MDVIMEGNAPFYGEVVTIYEPLAYYRVHDCNDNMYHVIDKARFDKMSRYITIKLDYFAGRCRSWRLPFDANAARDRSIWALECRLVRSKLTASGCPREDPVWPLLFLAARAYIDSIELPLSNRIISAVWFFSAVGPRVLARRLISLRFAIAARPAWFTRFLTIAAKVTAWSSSSPDIHAAES